MRLCADDVAVIVYVADDTGMWQVKDSHTPARGIPGPLTSTVIKRRRTEPDQDSEAGTESEIGSEREFEGYVSRR